MSIYQIAVDGPSGSGKSTLAKGVAKRLGIMYLDTGAMYRTCGLCALKKGIDPRNEDDVNAMLEDLNVEVKFEDGIQHMILNGEDVTGQIRTPEVSMAASSVSAHPNLRIKMVEIKGAPVTFDLEKLTERVRRVASGENCGWPLYNRMLHNPVEDALRVEGGLVILEGNYLLLDEDGWRELSQYADYTISVRADEELLRARLIDRRIKTGVDAERATKFVDFSDMPNVRVCLEKTMTADLRLRIGPDDDYYLCE